MTFKISNEKIQQDCELLEKFVKADNEILLYFYENYLPMVSRYICKNGGSEEDARDVFQEALMALYKQVKSGNFRLSASLKTYIFSICRYQWLKSFRKNERYESLPEDHTLIDLDSDAIKMLEKAEKFVLLQFHLSKLNSTGQLIMELYFKKYSTAKIAETLGLSKAYVKKRKYECKKELIKSIQNDLRFDELK